MTYILLFLIVTNLVISLFLLYKIRKIHLFCWDLDDKITKSSIDAIRNNEAFDALYKNLDLRYTLPPTMGFAGSADFLRIISDYTARSEVEQIVECSSGISTIVMAQTLKQKGKGHIYSLEHEEEYANLSRDNIKKYGLEDWVTIIHAPIKTYKFNGVEYSWYDIEGRLPDIAIDGLIIDGPPWSLCKNSRYPAGPELFNRLRNGAKIYLDDYIREDEQNVVKMWQKDFTNIKLFEHKFLKGCAD